MTARALLPPRTATPCGGDKRKISEDWKFRFHDSGVDHSLVVKVKIFSAI